MFAVQLDLFESNDDVTLLRKEVLQLKASHDAVRKSQFAKLNELSKMYIELREEMYRIRSAMIERKK